jgi:ParB family transcriptional regulator, chromosome partitioning protein
LTTNEAQLAREREQRRKELEKQKLETTVRYCTLAAVLRKVGAPLDRADLALIANAMLEKMEPLRREALARRHKLVDGSVREVTFPQMQKELARLLRQLDEIGLSRLLVEMALLGSVESSSPEGADALTTAARRHRIDVAKLRKDVEADLAAKLAKAAAKAKKPQPAKSAKPAKAA